LLLCRFGGERRWGGEAPRQRIDDDGWVISSGGNSSGSGFGNQSGGSGGSVWIEASALGGSGTISANGGSGTGGSAGSGGGGRIAIYYSTSTHALVLQARSGPTGAAIGGAGTVYEKDIDTDVFRLRVENGPVAVFGFRGAVLTSGAIGANCSRCDASSIELYLSPLM
jgi:hypothetical protein